MKKVVSVLLALCLAGSVIACGKAGSESGGLDDVEIWGAPGTEKVLQDKHGIYDSFRTEAKVEVLAARGEYEAGQIIMTAAKDITYDVTVQDLTTDDGKVFPSDNIEIFHEKYIEVYVNYENNGMPTGMYPDALVPFANIRDRGENTVRAGENQGVYVRFNVGVDQPAGVYTGVITLGIGKDSCEVPVKLTVANTVVSQTAHSKSIFLNEWHWQNGELDTTQEMYNKYTDALLDYRLSPNLIMVGSTHTEADIAEFVELAYDYMQDPRCSNITIPYKSTTVSGETCFDPIVFDRYLTVIAEKSLETHYNMFDKLICYFGFIDEPKIEILNRVKVVCTEFEKSIQKAADRVSGMEGSAEEKAELAQSILKIRNVVTSAYNSDFAQYIDTWCPQFQNYDNAELRSRYDDQEEKWWYGCIRPRVPFPTYHTEDTLLSARAVGWMMADYDVVGNLFWATTMYTAYNGSQYLFIEDLYGGNAARYPQANGDGYLFYPGKPYGVEGPVGTMRIEAIRDGQEDFEILYSLKEKYAGISANISENDPSLAFDEKDMIAGLTSLIYSGTRVTATSDTFASAREALLQLSEAADGADFCVVDYNDDGYGGKTFTVYADDGATVTSAGKPVAAENVREVSGGKLYTVSPDMNSEVNVLELAIEKNGKTYGYKQLLGGKVTINRAEQTTAADFGEGGVRPGYTLVDTAGITGADGKAVKIDLPATHSNQSQSFTVKGSMLNGIDRTAEKVIFHIWYDGTDNIQLGIDAKHEASIIQIAMATAELKQGMNEIAVLMSGKNWDALGDIEYIALYLGTKDGCQANTLYLVDTVVYDK